MDGEVFGESSGDWQERDLDCGYILSYRLL